MSWKAKWFDPSTLSSELILSLQLFLGNNQKLLQRLQSRKILLDHFVNNSKNLLVGFRVFEIEVGMHNLLPEVVGVLALFFCAFFVINNWTQRRHIRIVLVVDYQRSSLIILVMGVPAETLVGFVVILFLLFKALKTVLEILQTGFHLEFFEELDYWLLQRLLFLHH